VTPEEFKASVGKFPTGVTVISTKYQDKLFGLTANSFVSVSLEPPLVLFCLDKKSGSFNAFLDSDYFAISILAKNQGDIASHFAAHQKDKFVDIKTTISPNFALPLITDACAHLECKKYQQIESGDHYIFVGEVKSTNLNSKKEPLVYFAKSYAEVK